MTQPPPYQPPPHPAWTPQPPPPVPGRATAALVLGVLSLTCLGFLSGIPAMLLGRSAGREIAASGGRLGGDGIATAGFVTGLVGTLLSALALLALVGMFVLLGVTFDRNLDRLEEIERTPTPSCSPGSGPFADPLLEDCRP